MSFEIETPSHKALPPANVGSEERSFTVRATFEADADGALRSAVLRFTNTANPWAPRARYVELVAYNAESPGFGWRDGATPWRALNPAPAAPDLDAGRAEVEVDVLGRLARVSVNGSFVGEFESEALLTAEYVKAYPDEDGEFPYGRYANAGAAGRLVNLRVAGPIPPGLWAVFGVSLGLGVISAVLVAVLWARANKIVTRAPGK